MVVVTPAPGLRPTTVVTNSATASAAVDNCGTLLPYCQVMKGVCPPTVVIVAWDELPLLTVRHNYKKPW